MQGVNQITFLRLLKSLNGLERIPDYITFPSDVDLAFADTGHIYKRPKHLKIKQQRV